MICPVCQKLNIKSICWFGRYVHKYPTPDYYHDEEGNYHTHNEIQGGIEEYQCSNKHIWQIHTFRSCQTCNKIANWGGIEKIVIIDTSNWFKRLFRIKLKETP
jgi:hypothetical protein